LNDISGLSPRTTESRTEDAGHLLSIHSKRATPDDDDRQGTSAEMSSNREQNKKQSQGIGKNIEHR